MNDNLKMTSDQLVRALSTVPKQIVVVAFCAGRVRKFAVTGIRDDIEDKAITLTAREIYLKGNAEPDEEPLLRSF